MFNPKAVYIDTDAFSVYGSGLLRYLKSKIGIYLLLLVFSLITASTLFYFSSPKYQAVASFVLEERSPSSGVAGIASQMGVDLGALAGGSSGLLSVENIQEIVQSSRIMEQALLATVPGKKYRSLIYMCSLPEWLMSVVGKESLLRFLRHFLIGIRHCK